MSGRCGFVEATSPFLLSVIDGGVAFAGFPVDEALTDIVQYAGFHIVIDDKVHGVSRGVVGAVERVYLMGDFVLDDFAFAGGEKGFYDFIIYFEDEGYVM